MRTIPDSKIENHRVGGRLINRSEILRSMEFVNELAELFNRLQSDMQPSVTPSVTLAKLALTTGNNVENDRGEIWSVDRDGDVAMQNVGPLRDDQLLLGNQQDASECMDQCIFQIEVAISVYQDGRISYPGIEVKSFRRLFYGTYKQYFAASLRNGLAPLDSDIHGREVPYTYLPLSNLQDGIEIHDGLDDFFCDEVEFEGVPCRLNRELVDVPLLLQIRPQRVLFDRKHLRPYKDQSYVKFGEALYLDRYIRGGDPERRKRYRAIQDELHVCQNRLRLLRQSQTTVGPSGKALQRRYDDWNEEIGDVEQLASALRLERETLWAGDRDVAYDLTGVFMHQGADHSCGHYYFYSRNIPARPDEWYKFDDSQVTIVNKAEVLADTSGTTANAYLLVYARRNFEVVHAQNRLW
ncbi:hypothetical protein EV121DRAFT_297428 [Schizophyllum commune]